jgi:hypothetical protein
MRGIGAFGGFVLAVAALSSCFEADTDAPVHALAAPSSTPHAVRELELATPRPSMLADRVSVAERQDASASDTIDPVSLVDEKSGTSGLTPKPNPFLRALSSRPSATCTFLFDDAVEAADIEATLSVAGGHSRTRFFLVSGEPYLFDELDAGVATLTVLLGGSTFELARIEGITIPEIGSASDPRLASIDLRGRIHSFRARLLDAQGKPLRKKRVQVVDDEAGRAQALTTRNGWVTYAFPTPVSSLQATVEGFRTVRLFDGCTITLVPE